MAKGLDPVRSAHVRAFARELSEDGAELGRKLKTNQSTGWRILNGEGGIAFDTAEKIADLLGLDVQAMIEGRRVPLGGVRTAPDYAQVREQLPNFTPEVLDAATRVLDAIPVAQLTLENLKAAALFAQEHLPPVPKKETPPVGAAARMIAKQVEIRNGRRTRAKGE